MSSCASRHTRVLSVNSLSWNSFSANYWFIVQKSEQGLMMCFVEIKSNFKFFLKFYLSHTQVTNMVSTALGTVLTLGFSVCSSVCVCGCVCVCVCVCVCDSSRCQWMRGHV